MKLTLKKPIKIGEAEPVTTLTFREELVAGDFRGVAMRDPPHYEDMLKIAGRLCGQTEVAIDRLSAEDMVEVLKIVGGFMSGGPGTGSVASPS